MAISPWARSLWAPHHGSFCANRRSRPSSGIFDVFLPLGLAPLTRRAAVPSRVHDRRRPLRLRRGCSSLTREGTAIAWNKRLEAQICPSSASRHCLFLFRRAQHGATPKPIGGSAQPIIPRGAGARRARLTGSRDRCDTGRYRDENGRGDSGQPRGQERCQRGRRRRTRPCVTVWQHP